MASLRNTVRAIQAKQSSLIPYRGHVAGDKGEIVLNRGNVAMEMMRLHGTPFELAPPSLRNARASRINTLLRTIADPSLEICFHLVHHRGASDPPQPRSTNPFVRDLMEGYEKTALSSLFSNQWFITTLVDQQKDAQSYVKQYIPKLRREDGVLSLNEEQRRHLEEVVYTITTTLADYEPERLGIVEVPSDVGGVTIPFTQIGTALRLIRTAHYQPVPHTWGSLGAAIYDEPVICRPSFFYTGTGPEPFGAILCFLNYPAKPRVGMLNALMGAKYPFVMSHSFRYQSLGTLAGVYTIVLRQMKNAGSFAKKMIKGIEDTLDEVESMETAAGRHNFQLAIYAASPVELETNIADAKSRISQQGGAVPKREKNVWYDGALEAQYFGQLPGYPGLRPAPGDISTLDIAAMVSLDNYPAGKRKGYWGASPIRLRTRVGTSYDLETHNEDVGHFLCVGPNGRGKAQPLDALVLTPTGFRQMGDMKVGDPVLTPSGRVSRITGVFPQGEKEIYRLTLRDGRSVESCEEHLWKVWEQRSGKEIGKSHKTRGSVNLGRWEIRSLKEVMGWRSTRRRNMALPPVEPYAIEFPPQGELPISPYALGAMLGDGTLRKTGSLTFTTADPFMAGRLNSLLPEHELIGDIGNNGLDYRIRMRYRPPISVTVGKFICPLRGSLSQMGLLGKLAQDKFVPENYKRSSVADRLALLQGLMDTEGSVGDGGTRASFSTTSHKLAVDVQEIAWSLGAIAQVKPRQTYYTYLGCRKAGRPSYRISIVHPDISQMFTLPRKVAQCKPKRMRHRLNIRSIELIGKKQAQCIAIDDPDHLYVTDGYVATHNTVWGGVYMSAMEPVMGTNGIRLVIDKDDSNRLWIEASGGHHQRIIRNLPSGLAPLRAYSNTPQTQAFLHRLFTFVIERDKRGQLSNDEDRRLMRGIKRQLKMPAHKRSLGGVREFLGFRDPVNGAGARFERYCKGGSMGWLLDNDEQVVKMGPGLFGFDFGDLLPKEGMADDGSAEMAAAVIAHDLKQFMDGRRIFCLFDECKFYITVLAKLIEDFTLTGRKKELICGLLFQQPEHATESDIGSALVAQMRRKYVFPDTGYKPQHLRSIGLSEPAIKQVMGDMTVGNSRRFLIWDDEPVIVDFDLTGMPQLDILSARSGSVPLFDAIRLEQPSAEMADVVAEFHRRNDERKAA